MLVTIALILAITVCVVYINNNSGILQKMGVVFTFLVLCCIALLAGFCLAEMFPIL